MTILEGGPKQGRVDVPVQRKPMPLETPNVADTSLTFGITRDRRNAYDFADRGASVALDRQRRNIKEGEVLPGGPWTMEIMPTDTCNVGCDWCFYAVSRDNHMNQVLDLRAAGQKDAKPFLFKNDTMNLLDSLDRGGSTRGLYWAGGGEPLAYPFIVDGLVRGAEFGQNFVQTNGVALNKLTKSEELLGTLRLLSISAVGYDEVSTNGVHHTNSFDRIDRNVREVMGMRNAYRESQGRQGLGDLDVNAKIMVDKTNYLYLPQMVQYWRDDLQVDIVAIRPVQNYMYEVDGDGTPKEQYGLTDEHKAELQALIRDHHWDDPDLRRFAIFLGVRAQPTPKTEHCFNATQGQFAVVNAKGEVFLGNPEINHDEYSIGNIKTQPWDQIWNGERHKAVVARMDAEQQAGKCRTDLCRHTTTNQGVQEFNNGQREGRRPEEVNLVSFL